MYQEQCVVCGNFISSKADSCPQCGHPRNEGKSRSLLNRLARGVFIAFGLGLLALSGLFVLVLLLIGDGTPTSPYNKRHNELVGMSSAERRSSLSELVSGSCAATGAKFGHLAENSTAYWLVGCEGRGVQLVIIPAGFESPSVISCAAASRANFDCSDLLD